MRRARKWKGEPIVRPVKLRVCDTPARVVLVKVASIEVPAPLNAVPTAFDSTSSLALLRPFGEDTCIDTW